MSRWPRMDTRDTVRIEADRPGGCVTHHLLRVTKTWAYFTANGTHNGPDCPAQRYCFPLLDIHGASDVWEEVRERVYPLGKKPEYQDAAWQDVRRISLTLSGMLRLAQ